jgi:formamidopyrimidine-DNA glycosylase
MPELPEVETTKNGIKDFITNQKVTNLIIREFQLRWKIPENLPKLIKNQTLLEVTRRAKYLLLRFNNGYLIIHLGMSGNLRILHGEYPAKKHDHVDIVFANNVTLRYHDPRKFGCILWCDAKPEEHRLIKHLGPEPLENAFNSKHLLNACLRRKGNIKQTIMNAKLVVGVGNIYASEALHLSHIHPLTPANTLDNNSCAALCKNIKHVLRQSIKAGGTTLKDFSGADGKPGYFSQQLNVYGRDGECCNNCKAEIQRVIIGGRSTFFCPQCQSL